MTTKLAPTRSGRPRPPIDPRIRERRIKVKRDAGRRRLRVLLGLLLAMVVLGGLVLLTRTPLLDVDDLRVSGAASTPIASVTEASGIAAGDPMLEVDVNGADRAVEALPWVDSAEISRHWPGTVEIRVVEHEPAALVEGIAGSGLVSSGGAVIAEVEVFPEELPQILLVAEEVPSPGDSLSEVHAEALGVVLSLDSDIEGLIDLTRVEPAETGPEVYFELAGGGVIRFGEIELVEEKLVAMSTLLSGQVVLLGLDTIDVRVPSLPVITRLPGFELSAPIETDGQIHPSEAVASDD